MLVKPAFRALVLTVVAGMPVALIGCGAKDAPNSTGVDATSVNPDDQKSWDDFLKSIDVTPTPEAREELGTERASPKRGAFLIYPVGEVRKVGLKKFRIDVTTDFDAKGTLRFSKGSKTLYETAFDPASLTKESFVAQLPSAVLETLAAGDSVKWGLDFDDKKVKDLSATFKVIDKSQATKEIAKKIDANKALASTPTIRDLARAEILMNYSLYSEVVELLSEVAASDKTLQAPYLPLANALRRLKLKDSPLFQESLARAGAGTSSRRGGLPGGPIAGGVGSGDNPTVGLPQPHGGEMVKPGSMPIAKSAGNGPKGLAPGGSVPPGLRPMGGDETAMKAEDVPPEAKTAFEAWMAARAAQAVRAQVLAKKAQEAADRATHLALQADMAATKAQEAEANVADLQQKLEAAFAALNANPGDLALSEEVVKLTAQVDAAKAAALAAQEAAKKAQHIADIAAKVAQDAKKQAEQAGTTLNPGMGPVPLPQPNQGLPSLSDAASALKTAWDTAASAEQTVQAAFAALDAAEQALMTATPATVGELTLARDQAFAAVQAAEQTAAEAAAEAAEAQAKYEKAYAASQK
jgi:murein DD-endopeptidase MepM/ murein hydrolase activator NlpD